MQVLYRFAFPIGRLFIISLAGRAVVTPINERNFKTFDCANLKIRLMKTRCLSLIINIFHVSSILHLFYLVAL